MTKPPVHLRCEYFDNPLGIDELRPRLSWQLDDPRRGARQTAYQIVVASSPDLKSVLWDTGQVTSDQNVQVEYAGAKLRSRQRCYWRVRYWNDAGEVSPGSATATWEMGLLQRADWRAHWIASGRPGAHDKTEPSPCLRKPFALRGPVARARLYATALGLYELWLNGQRVGTDYFTPGWTDYHVRAQYQTYDVTALLRAGENALGGILADGWYCGYLAWQNHRNTYGHTPRLLAQLEVEYADGRRELVVTDASWRSATGPILAADIYNGETYDARRELPGWSEPGFAADGWLPARVLKPTRITLNASASPRVRQIQEIKPIGLTEPQPGRFVFDFGQNLAGWARLVVTGSAGTTVTLRFAEVLNPDGTIYTTNLRSARCTDQYTLKGGGRETYEPRFTFHGFRYVEVTGYPGRPAADAITGIVVHSDIRPTGTFECSHPMLNQLQHNIQWGQKGNFLDVPTDCPQRDERLGWTGDAQVFIRTAAFNADVAGFFGKWLVDLTDAQGPSGTFPKVAPDVLEQKNGDGGAAWADAGIICPWTIYLCYGDRRVLERHYPAMKRYVAFLQTVDHRARHGFGDWLNIEDTTPKDLISVAFAAFSTQLLAQIAAVLGQRRDATKFRRWARQLKGKFRREFLSATGRLVGDSQTAHVLALQLELLPKSRRAPTAARLVQRLHERQDHLSTGFVGTPYLLVVLAQTGHLDLAYKLLLNDDFPSWGYPIKHGATTMWERWDGWRHDKGFQDPHMNSFNHYAYGAVGEWLYRCVAGLDLDPAAPGYKHILVRPRFGGGLSTAQASYDSPYGRIATEWELTKKTFRLALQIPANAWATVYLPQDQPRHVTESGHSLARATGVSHIRVREGCTICDVASGAYQFEARQPRTAGWQPAKKRLQSNRPRSRGSATLQHG